MIREFLVLIFMLFCHIVDDFYLQGILAKFKQKSWWESNYSKSLYKHDYFISLLIHAFSWIVSVHLPLFVIMILRNVYINQYTFALLFLVNWLIHAFIDDLKANKLKISLLQDQLLHVIQIVVIWFIYIFVEGMLL